MASSDAWLAIVHSFVYTKEQRTKQTLRYYIFSVKNKLLQKNVRISNSLQVDQPLYYIAVNADFYRCGR